MLVRPPVLCLIDAGGFKSFRQANQLLCLPLQFRLLPPRSSCRALAMSEGAVAAISAPFSAKRSEAAIRGMLSTVMRITDRSMAAKAYQATALATAVSAAIPQKAKKSLALMPSIGSARVLSAAFVLGISVSMLFMLSWDMLQPISVPLTEGAPRVASVSEPDDWLDAAVRLDDGEENSVHTLVVVRAVGKRDPAEVEGAALFDGRKQTGARH